MSITLESVALCVVIFLLVGIAATIIVAVIGREWIRQRVAKEQKDTEMLAAIKSVHSAMQLVAERILDKAVLAKENHIQMLSECHDIINLVVDVEKRLTEQVKETRDIARDAIRSSGSPLVQLSTGDGAANQAGDNKNERR